MGGSNSSDNEIQSALQQPNRLVIDCRSAGEFSCGDGFTEAVNIPIDSLESRLGEILPKDRTIVTYCAAGARAARAANILKSHGYSQVFSATNAAHIRKLLKF
jgi:phage shock protein E